MPRARRKPERLRQIFRWLQTEYPLPNVKLSLVSNKLGEDFAWTEDNAARDGVVIFLNSRKPLDVLTETILHEYAHAMCWAVDRTRHSPAWGMAYAKLYDRYHDLAGEDDSCCV
jgi:uncharacterized protein YjaZ